MKILNKRKLNLIVVLAAAAFNFSSCSKDDDGSKEEYQVYDSHIALEGEDNMRDLGGYKGESNKRVLYRKLFRSGELSGLTALDLQELTGLGINNVIDLRTTEEREEHPDVLPEGLVSQHFSLIVEDGENGTTGASSITSQIISGEVDAVELMMGAYTVDEHKIEKWTTIFNMLEQDNQVSLWHCTAGKDRAGMTAALILASLGVDKETIIEDFLESNTYLHDYIEGTVAYISQSYGEEAGENMRPLLGVQIEFIDAFYDDIDTNHGGMENFLAELDVDIAKMRANYLEK